MYPVNIRTMIFLVCCLIAPLFFPATKATAGPVETKISQSVLQSFVDAAFPVAVKHDIDLMGTGKLPITINFHHPGPVTLAKPEGPAGSFLKLAMEYEISSQSILIAPSKGSLGGDFTVVLSHDQEFLLLSFGEMNLQVTPWLRIPLAALLKPIKVPLFKGIPVKVQEKEICGRFKDIRVDVQGSDLVIRSDFYFEKPPQQKCEERKG